MTKVLRNELAAEKERRIQISLHQFRAGMRALRKTNPEEADALERALEERLRAKP